MTSSYSPAPRASRRYQAANENDPIKAEYRRLAKAQTILRGSLNTTLEFGVFLSSDHCFYVASKRFQRAIKNSRKTVHNHLKTLERHGFIMKLERRFGPFPVYMLTSLDAWRQLAGEDASKSTQTSEKITQGLGNKYPRKTPTNLQTFKRGLRRPVPLDDELEEVASHIVPDLKPFDPNEAAHLPVWLWSKFLQRFGLGAARSWLFGGAWNEAGRALEVGDLAYYWFQRDARRFCIDNNITVRGRSNTHS